MKPHTLIASLVALCLLLAGCASSLPDVKGVVASTPAAEPPEIQGPGKVLSPRQANAVIGKLEKDAGPSGILDRQVKLMQEVSGARLYADNKATLLVDGPATYKAMFEVIGDARDSINLETYIFDDDETGRKFADLLLKKRAEGVQVNIIYDSVGCIGTPASFFKRLKDGGIHVLEYNPVNPLKVRKSWRIKQRDHRKLLVVDGKTAFTGGVNISGVYRSSVFSGDSDEKAGGAAMPWRDTHLVIRGPAVAEFQRHFMNTWKWQKGPELPARDYFPALKKEGSDLVMVIASRAGEKNRQNYVMYYSAIVSAAQYIHLTNAYFIPDGDTADALVDAAKRGVDVKVVVPSISDEPTAFYAGRSYYTELLKGGVRLYEMKGGMLHAKTGVIDGVWSTVGSSNMDMQSFANNNELNAVVLGADFASEMEAMFDGDLANSTEVTLADWKKRPFKDRLREWFSRLLKPWL